MVRLYVAPVPVQPFASVALTVIGNVPTTVGVPDSVPFAASVRPDGSVPLASVKVVAPVPLQPLESVALTVMVNVPVCVGAPERTPLLPSVRPEGSVPLASENVVVPMPPLCAKVWLNAAPATPLFTAGFVTVMVWQV